MKIIPAIDIIDGQCVRLAEGDYNKKTVYSSNPLEVAQTFESSGIKYLHLVDLDGAKSTGVINWKVLKEISENTNLEIDFGGGIKTSDDLNKAYDLGASTVSIGSIAVSNQALFLNWLSRYGAEKINLGADCKSRIIASYGWLKDGGVDIFNFISTYIDNGVQNIVCTDISKDGMLNGPSFELYKELLSKFKFNLIASGGVSSMEDIIKLKDLGCDGVIVGKAIYEGLITLKEIQSLC